MTNTRENKSGNNDQQEEIDSLRDHFNNNIRILTSIGEFSYILKIRSDQYDVSLTVQLDESYPSKVPEIIITAPRLTPEQITFVQQLLQSHCETLLNKPMIMSIYSCLIQWLVENNIPTLDTNSINMNSSIRHLEKNVKKNHSNKNNEHDNDHVKRSSMKTVEDVISRIEWDDHLDKRYFRVGYMDRFLGLQEKSFNDFDFKIDLASISDQHSNILAIPKHRIKYFKYKNEIIWDKETRIDLMFGSTGNQQTIYDVIKRHENSLENDFTSSISDDDIVENIDTNILLPRYLTLTDSTYKPNYFLSIPITDSTLLNRYITYQEHLLLSYPLIFSSHTNLSNVHVTLLTLRIESLTQLEQCIIIMKSLQQEIFHHCSYPEAICLEFRDINTFNDRILYIKCTNNQRLEDLRTLIVQRFTEELQKHKFNGIFFAGNYYEFIPHITLLKCKRKFSSMCLNEPKNIYIGQQIIHSLQLCSIGKNECNEQKTNCLFQLDLN